MCKPGRLSAKKMNLAAYALVFLLALEHNNAENIDSSCQISGCPTGSLCVDTMNHFCSNESIPDCQCMMQENLTGLILSKGLRYLEIDTVPTAPDGTPSFNERKTYATYLRYWSVYSMDVDYALHQAYLHSRNKRAIISVQNCPNDFSTPKNWTYLHKGISGMSVQLAVDWISHNIYWNDPYFRWIMVQSLLSNDESMYHVLIDDNLNHPISLALDPMEGLLFWGDVGPFTKIEVSSLSGRNRKTLITLNKSKPTCLVADHVDQRLYFIMRHDHIIKSITYEGSDLKTVYDKTYSHFKDMAVYKDYLYVTDTRAGGMILLNKTNGTLLKTIRLANFDAVAVFRPEAQPNPTKAHCASYGCEQICVSEKDIATCLCKDGYTLNQDKKTCSLSKTSFQRGVIYSDESNICIMDIRSLVGFVFDSKCVLNTTGTKYMALDTDERNIFFANDTAIYWAGVDNLELHQLTETSGIISGMAWDGLKRNLYWTEENTGLIWRASAESGNATVFLEGLNKPRDIMILPHERRVYWISDMNGTNIETSSINGSNHQIILDSSHLKDPSSLGYDAITKRIFVTDDGKMKSYNLEGTVQHSSYEFRKKYETLEFENCEIYKGFSLMTARDGQNTTIVTVAIDTKMRIAERTISGNITAIKVFDGTLRQEETVLE